MAIIKCPECGKEVSDKAETCIGCGYPIKKEMPADTINSIVDELRMKYGSDKIAIMKELRERTELGFKEASDVVERSLRGETPKETFDGIYRFSLWSGKKEVRCPRCGSAKCSHYQEQRMIKGKTKTRYTVNLNPFRPFTLLNKKEKAVKKDRLETVCRFVCDECGKIFD